MYVHSYARPTMPCIHLVNFTWSISPGIRQLYSSARVHDNYEDYELLSSVYRRRGVVSDVLRMRK